MRCPTESKIRTMLAESGKNDLTAYVDDVLDSPLLKTEPKPGKVTSEKTDEKLGITELVLSNGVKVLLKPTDFKNDEILDSGYREGWIFFISRGERNGDH